jgi:hypothetical protein
MFKRGDTVIVSDFSRPSPGKIIDITGNLYCVEFGSTDFDWYTESSLELAYTEDSWKRVDPDFTSKVDPKYCYHDWKKDSYFTANVYITCTKCNARKEDT